MERDLTNTPYIAPPIEDGVTIVNIEDLERTHANRENPEWVRQAWAQHGIEVGNPESVQACDDDQLLSLWMDLCIHCKDQTLQHSCGELLTRVQGWYFADEEQD